MTGLGQGHYSHALEVEELNLFHDLLSIAQLDVISVLAITIQ